MQSADNLLQTVNLMQSGSSIAVNVRETAKSKLSIILLTDRKQRNVLIMYATYFGLKKILSAYHRTAILVPERATSRRLELPYLWH